MDWGTSALGDMGAHLIDHAYWALDLDYPDSVWTSSTPFERVDHAAWPQSQMTQYEFTGKDGQAIRMMWYDGSQYEFTGKDGQAIRMMWYDGGIIAPRPSALPDDVVLRPGGGGLLIGDQGVLLYDTYGHDPRMYPESLMEEYADVPKTLPRIQESHEMNWVNACKGLAEATCPFSYAVPLTEVMLLGVVALQHNGLIKYDAETMTIPNAAEAEQYLHRPYREGWEI